jgi:soluble lytic murein transglycosylase-like protein
MKHLGKIWAAGGIMLAGALLANIPQNSTQENSPKPEIAFSTPDTPQIFLENIVEPIPFPIYPSIDNNTELQPYRDLIIEKAIKYDFDPDYVARIIWQESRGDPSAVSHRGAEGWMQLMPSTQDRYDVQDPEDREESLEAGLKHLRWLTDKFGGDQEQGLAAYNTGQVRVRKALKPNTGRTKKQIHRIENGNDVWEYPTYEYHDYELRTERLDSETRGYLTAINGEPGK